MRKILKPAGSVSETLYIKELHGNKKVFWTRLLVQNTLLIAVLANLLFFFQKHH